MAFLTNPQSLVRSTMQKAVRRKLAAAAKAGPEYPGELHARFVQAVRTLSDLPSLHGQRNAVTGLPWYLILGEGGAGKTTALQQVGSFSKVASASQITGVTADCEWWLSNEVVVLDTAGRYAIPTDTEQDRGEWYALLQLLSRYRRKEPLNGIIVTVGVDTLASSTQDELHTHAKTLRDRVNEAIQTLGFDIPVYVLVTKLDLLEGFGEFVEQLPDRLVNGAVGYLDDPPPRLSSRRGPKRGQYASQRLVSGLDGVYERLHHVRLSLFAQDAPEVVRPALFGFPEEVRALLTPLSQLIEVLSSEDARYYMPLVRGVFFSSAQQAGTAVSLLRDQFSMAGAVSAVSEQQRPYFLYDLFTQVLPRDRPLAALTPYKMRRRRLLQLLALVCGAGLACVPLFFIPEPTGPADPAGLYKVIRPTQIREHPDLAMSGLATLEPGTRVNVVGVQEDFVEIHSLEKDGIIPVYVPRADVERLTPEATA